MLSDEVKGCMICELVGNLVLAVVVSTLWAMDHLMVMDDQDPWKKLYFILSH